MKTQINDYYIDLYQILAIGPLDGSRGQYRNSTEQPQYGCVIYLTGATNLWIAVVPDVLNNSIDTAHNDAIKAKAKSAYDQLIAQWKAAP